jgi:hypothetical protein
MTLAWLYLDGDTLKAPNKSEPSRVLGRLSTRL